MNNILITIGVLIVAVLSALFAVPYFVDWNSYRGVIEEEASRIVGRDVRIGGTITLTLLPAPSFTLQKLRVADASTGSGEPLFRADRVDAKLSVMPLVRGKFEANEIELVKPELRFVIDDAGLGNWRSLVRGQGSLPFVPNDVALQSVKITEGTFGVFDRNGGRQRIALDHINGQLSAPALEGPYRFRGGFGEGAAARELRFTTLPSDSDGVVQLKLNLKDVGTNAAATLDARVRELGGQPQVTGELSALVPMPGSSAMPANGVKTVATPMADLKANVVGNAQQIALNDLSVAFEGSGRPEVLAGGAVFTWAGERSTVAKLSAPWIDLDNVLGNPAGGNPLLALADFAQRINSLGTGIGAASAVLEIDQASLGHDSVGAIRIEARSSGGALAVEQLRASLPGGTKFEMQGRIIGEGGATTFDGDMTVRGTSLARLAGWATAGRTAISPVNDLPFQVRSRVTAEPARGGLRDLFAEIGDSTIEGEIDYAWTGSRKLRVTLEGPRFDARALAPGQSSLRTLADALTSPADAPAPGTVASTGIFVSLKTAELVLPDQKLRDVSAIVESVGGNLLVERLQFSADHGVAVTLDGQLGGSGQLRGAVAAGDAQGVQKLGEFLGFPLTSVIPSALLADAVPLRLAGVLVPASEGHRSGAQLTLDGRLGKVDTKIKIALQGAVAAWHTAAADIDLVLLAPPEAQLAAKVLAALRLEPSTPAGDAASKYPSAIAVPSGADQPATAGGTATTRLAVRATGIPADGLATAVRFDSPDITVYLNGSSHVSSAGVLQMGGDVSVDARDGRGAVDALGGLRLALPEPLVVQGTARLFARGGAVSLGKIGLVSARGARIAGRLALDPPAAAGSAVPPDRRRLGGDLTFSSLDVTSMLSLVLQTPIADTLAAAQAATGRSGLWPEATFAFTRNRDVEAFIGIRAEKLTVSGDVGLTDVDLKLVSRPGVLEWRDMRGTGMGGRLSSAGSIEATPAGAMLKSTTEIAQLQLVKFGGTGSADLNLSVTGSGNNLAGIVAGLSGNGTLKLDVAATAFEITPATLQSAVDSALKAPAEKLTATLRTALAADTARAPVTIGPRTLVVIVQDGIARTQPFSVVNVGGKSTGTAALDLATFGTSGDWRVETRMPALPVVPAAAGAPIVAPQPTPVLLPAVVQRFATVPSELEASRTTRRSLVETEALERELAVRKVEHDLAELERLRRMDEERAAARLRDEKAVDDATKAWQSETKAAIGASEQAPAQVQRP